MKPSDIDQQSNWLFVDYNGIYANWNHIVVN